MAILTAQYIIQMNTNIPADAVINSFHFTTPGEVVLPIELDEIVAALKEFYDAFLPNGNKLAGILSGNDVSLQLRRIKIRKRQAIKPEPVLREVVYTSDAGGAVGAFPHEVALCLSYRGVTPAGISPRRRRGRIYLGPLSDASTLKISTGGDVRPTLFARTTVQQAATRLRDRNGPAIWSTYSTIDGAASPVINGWIDDAYDTQRRRGTDALQRTNW
jgi:hypothetical protein